MGGLAGARNRGAAGAAYCWPPASPWSWWSGSASFAPAGWRPRRRRSPGRVRLGRAPGGERGSARRGGLHRAGGGEPGRALRPPVASGHHGERAEHDLAQRLIAVDPDPGARGAVPESLGEQPPGGVVGQGHRSVGGRVPPAKSRQAPASRPKGPVPATGPSMASSTAVPSPVHHPIGHRNRPDEEREHRMEPFPRGQRPRADGVTDLLLVQPALGIVRRHRTSARTSPPPPRPRPSGPVRPDRSTGTARSPSGRSPRAAR